MNQSRGTVKKVKNFLNNQKLEIKAIDRNNSSKLGKIQLVEVARSRGICGKTFFRKNFEILK